MQQSKTPPRQEERHFKYIQKQCCVLGHSYYKYLCVCVFGSFFCLACVRHEEFFVCVRICVFRFPACHLVSLDESILGLEGGCVPGHFQDGGRHSRHSDRLRGHRWSCRRRGISLDCLCVCAQLGVRVGSREDMFYPSN